MPVFLDDTHTHIILTSGRAGTKSSFVSIKAVCKALEARKCSIVVLRKFHNKIRKTVYREALRAINRLTVPKSRFKITVSPMEIRYNRTGNTIFFTGNDSIDDTKGMIDETRPIKYVIVDELTEFFDNGEGEDELLNIEATFARGNDDSFQMLYLFNPPKNPNAPVMAWLEKMRRRPDVLYVHTDYRDVPEKWLGRKLIESAEILKQSDEKLYNWVWLGQCIGIDEIVYYMFEKSRHVKEPPKDQTGRIIPPDIIGVGIDYGQQNATTFQAGGVWLKQQRLCGLGEYYHSGRETGRQRSPSQYALDFKEFCEKIEKETGSPVSYVFIDPSAQGLSEEIKKVMPGIRVKNAQNNVALGISRVQKVLTYGVASISPEQRNLEREFGLYSYDTKSIEKGKEVPVKESDHCLDSWRYLIMGLWKYIKRFLPAGEEDKKDVDSEPD